MTPLRIRGLANSFRRRRFYQQSHHCQISAYHYALISIKTRLIFDQYSKRQLIFMPKKQPTPACQTDCIGPSGFVAQFWASPARNWWNRTTLRISPLGLRCGWFWKKRTMWQMTVEILTPTERPSLHSNAGGELCACPIHSQNTVDETAPKRFSGQVEL